MTEGRRNPARSLTVDRHQASDARAIRRVTWVGMGVNVVLAGVKFVGGTLAGSHALVADAVHSLSDLSTDVALLMGMAFWSAPPDAEHPYGHRRIETLIAVVIGLILGIVGAGIAVDAIRRLDAPPAPPPTVLALAVALLAIVAKEVIYRVTRTVARREKSPALLANAWHHRSDALSSLPVAIAVGGAAINPAWVKLDIIGALVVSAFILHAAWGIVGPSLNKLIDRGAPPELCERIAAIAQETEGVQGIHSLRTRYQGGSLFVDLHVEVAPDLTVRRGHDISENVRTRLLRECDDVVEVLTHLDYEDDRDQEAAIGTS